MATPFMFLTLPVPADDPGPTAGPQWAHDLNTALGLVDSHDHSAGAGAAIAVSASGGIDHAPITNALTIKLDGVSLSLGPGGIRVTNPATGSNTGDVTIGTPNGLSLLGQILSLSLAVAGGANGALLGTDKTKLDNLSGVNTGDVTLDVAPNGLTLVGQVLGLTLASASTFGAVSNAAQVIAGSKTFTSALKGQPEAEALLAGGGPTFANSYVVNYNVDGTVNFETWTDSGTTFLRRRIDYTYAFGQVDTIRIRIYSATDGVTVVGDMTETIIYTGSQVTGSTTTRAV